ncbi:MAG: hypothetical protein ACOZD0_05020 [Pseudomonadota bacterium]
MSKVLKALALLLLVTTLVWGVTIWQWQRAPRELGNHQIVFHLVLLPAALSVLAWGLYAFVGALMRHARRTGSAPTAPAQDGSQAVQDPAAATAEAERRWAHALWAAAAVGGPASSLDELSAGLQAGELRPGVDTELIDSRGLPVFAARCPDLHTEDVWDELDRLSRALAADGAGAEAGDQASMAPTEPGERCVRALALLEQPLHETLAAFAVLAEPLQPQRRRGELSSAAQAAPRFVVADETGEVWPASALARDAAARRTVAATGHPAPTANIARQGSPAHAFAAPPTATICLLAPADWTSAERQLARLWLSRRLAAALPELPLSEAVVVLPCAQAEQGLQQLDQRLVNWRREGRLGLLLVLAAESQIGADWVDRLEAHGLLFSGERPEGRVPGEAAVALLLSTPDWPAPAEATLPDGSEAPLRLHRPAIARRSQPAGGQRVSATALKQAASQALEAAGLAPQRPADGAADTAVADDDAPPLLPLACTDLDTRPSRSGEAAQALLAALPGLDPVSDVCALGQALGDVGLPRALLAIALASRLVRERAEPAFIFTVHDPLERAALVLAPAAPAAPSSATHDATLAPGAAVTA